MRTAAYARYSSDSQREASIEDQLRNCRAFCARHGWAEPVVYSDAAISGARNDRPGYRKLLAEASRFDVIVVDDLSRLSRDSIESAQAVKRLTFAGVRLVGVSDGVDTGRKGHAVDVGLRGLMSELYLSDLAEKTHRGLTGRALAGASAGGLPYGYRVAGVGQRAIDDAQAAVVRRIFALFIGGATARSIASTLNAEAVPSSRGGQWCASAIFGDVRRGIGILANPIYVGRQVWNRSRWIKHPDSGRRVRVERPESEWMVNEHPELAIIDLDTWEDARARLRGASRDTASARGPGRPAKHLLSGILRCAECGGPMAVVDAYSYACSARKERGDAVCASTLRVPRKKAEHALLRTVRKDLLSEEAERHFLREMQSAVKRLAPDTDAPRRKLQAAEKDRDNIMAAIRAGILTPSTKAELEKAEREIAISTREAEAAKRFQPSQIMPREKARWQRMVHGLDQYGRDDAAARAALRELLGENITARRNENGDLFAEITALNSQISVVAGAGFGRYLRQVEPLRILIEPAHSTPRKVRGAT